MKKLKGSVIMGCCGGGNHQNNRKVKEWGNEDCQNNSSVRSNPILIIVGLLLLGLAIYKFVI
ncbi:hypothetical protein KQI38_15880 [Tissierella carlieri]|uniref:Uncharacterized protein n=1 Tax=Tissierella carlieri TaxID=689904 RepID=A0ABT1SE05_9FIRM|nr:hypothetical protein [Tissierella carlieri]MBU5313502.1 hypothetical protein [Tissierella carlieri]MCQ4924710.1 hypothetical protein [Tissierella carlieri]